MRSREADSAFEPRIQSRAVSDLALEWTEGVRLSRAITARFGERDALIVDLDVDRALIDHDEPVEEGAAVPIEFQFEGHTLNFVGRLHSRTPRLFLGQTLWRSVVLLTEPEGESDLHLAEGVSEYSSRILQALEANATGARDENRVEGDETITTLGAAMRLGGHSFVVYDFQGGQWNKRVSLLPEQPEDGFTVSSLEDPKQVDELCRAYEHAGSEARTLIRMMAELAIGP